MPRKALVLSIRAFSYSATRISNIERPASLLSHAGPQAPLPAMPPEAAEVPLELIEVFESRLVPGCFRSHCGQGCPRSGRSARCPAAPITGAFMISHGHCAIIGENLFFAFVNDRPRAAFMFMDDDQKEINVSPTAANTLYMSDPTGSATGSMPLMAVSGNAEGEDLAVLFRNHYKDIFGAAYRITGSASDAEDVLQTVFLRLTSSGARRDLSPNPGGYLHRAAVNASLDLLRGRARSNSVSIDVLDFDTSFKNTGLNPEEELADTELRDLVRHAVAKLGGRSAAAFALRYFEGYGNAEIAEILGTSQLAIAVTLHRARTRLRKEIGRYLEKHHEAQ